MKIEISARFSVNFQFRAEAKKVTSRAKLKNLQLELWPEPAWLGLINTSFSSHNNWAKIFFQKTDTASYIQEELENGN